MILLIVGLCLLGLGAFAFCVILIIRYFIRPNYIQNTHGKVPNSSEI